MRVATYIIASPADRRTRTSGRTRPQGSESDARNNGLLFFGGWAAISVVARNAGLMSGQYAVPCLAWNAACAAYSVLA